MYNMTAGATPNETMSPKESIVSPNTTCSMLSLLNNLANGPSMASNITAKNNSCADNITLFCSIEIIEKKPHSAFANEATSANVIIFNMFVSIFVLPFYLVYIYLCIT